MLFLHVAIIVQGLRQCSSFGIDAVKRARPGLARAGNAQGKMHGYDQSFTKTTAEEFRARP